MTLASSVVVWDNTADPDHASATQVLCWRSYAQGESIASIPRYLEEHAESIRETYLAFIHALGEHRIAGRRVIDHLDLGDGFSLWWMTLIAEKSPLKSPRIYDCLRLIALEEILTEKRPAELMLVSSNRALSAAIGGLCKSLSITYRWQRSRTPKPESSLRRLYSALPSAVRGVLSLRYVAIRWPLWRLQNTEWFSGPNATFFCSYFIHLDPTLCARGQFYSRQWGELPQFLHEGGMRTNWLQLFLVSAAVPDVRRGVSWVQRFNRDACNQGRHTFLDNYLTWRTLLGALKNWWWLNRVRWRLSGIRSAFNPRGTGLCLWPILRSDWLASLTGPSGMSNCLYVALLDAAFAAAPHQRIGLYLYENQPWEMALLRAWRRHGHGQIVGVQHSTTPFWYLPHSISPGSQGSGAAPMPDCLAVNGPAARSAFVGAGIPLEKLVEVEALRYLGLAALACTRRAESRPGRGVERAVCGRPALKVLVLGEIAPLSMTHLLKLLEDAFEFIPLGFKFTLKAHPGHAVSLADYPRLRVEQTDLALGELLGDYDIAIAANSTSAAVDAFVAGLPVIIGLHGGSLNLSPLRCQAGVRFVSTSKELVDALRAAACGGAGDRDREDFFFLDPGLPRWKRLLGCAGGG